MLNVEQYGFFNYSTAIQCSAIIAIKNNVKAMFNDIENLYVVGWKQVIMMQ